ncbi:hypothetical protein C8R44DRAFT_746410 [Mycena epipterygia]|nr:hypothetical protein C8R44DRAFT_746410 [Mycena epipterygia]
MVDKAEAEKVMVGIGIGNAIQQCNDWTKRNSCDERVAIVISNWQETKKKDFKGGERIEMFEDDTPWELVTKPAIGDANQKQRIGIYHRLNERLVLYKLSSLDDKQKSHSIAVRTPSQGNMTAWRIYVVFLAEKTRREGLTIEAGTPRDQRQAGKRESVRDKSGMTASHVPNSAGLCPPRTGDWQLSQTNTSTVLLKIQTKLDQICEMYTLVLSRVDFPIFALEG